MVEMEANGSTVNMKEEKNWEAEVVLCQKDHWEMKQETQDYILMKKNSAKPVVHALIFIATFWWTGGVANVLYWAMNKRQKMILKRV